MGMAVSRELVERLTERAAAERAEAERIELGEDELMILEELGDD